MIGTLLHWDLRRVSMLRLQLVLRCKLPAENLFIFKQEIPN